MKLRIMELRYIHVIHEDKEMPFIDTAQVVLGCIDDNNYGIKKFATLLPFTFQEIMMSGVNDELFTFAIIGDLTNPQRNRCTGSFIVTEKTIIF